MAMGPRNVCAQSRIVILHREENERLKASGALPSPKSSPTLLTTIPQSVRHCPPTLRALIQRALAKNQLTQQKMLFIDKELQYIMNG